MKNLTNTYSNPKQAVLPLFIQDYLDICDPVLTFDRFMGEIDLEKYLKEISKHEMGRLRYNPVSMLKTILFGFMTNGYVSLTVKITLFALKVNIYLSNFNKYFL